MKNIKSFIAGVLFTILAVTLTSTVFGTQLNQTITAIYRDIKIIIDGKEIIPKNADGNIAEPFIVDGTTYLPVRAISEAVGYDVSWNDETNTIVLIKKQTPEAEDFIDGNLDCFYTDEYSGPVAVKGISLRFHGEQNYIDEADFSDMVLTKDGIPLDAGLKYDKLLYYPEYYQDITYFYFLFEQEINEPGIYRFSGKYKGVEYESMYKLIEELPIRGSQANPDDLIGVRFDHLIGESINMIWFDFNKIQQTFYISDLTDLKLTLNGTEIERSLKEEYAGRQLFIENDGVTIYTRYYFYLNEPLVDWGIYQITGEYMGKQFTAETVIPDNSENQIN